MNKAPAPKTPSKAARPPVAAVRGRFAGRATRHVSVEDMAEAAKAEAASRRAPPLR